MSSITSDRAPRSSRRRGDGAQAARRKAAGTVRRRARGPGGGRVVRPDWWTNGRFIESTDDAYVGGNVTAIAPHVGGFIAKVLVTDNQRVKAGQLLIQLDSRDYQAALDHAKAVVDARAASLDGLRAQYVLQQATIRQQEAEVAAKSAQLTFAAQDAARYQALSPRPAPGRGRMRSARHRSRSRRSASLVAACRHARSRPPAAQGADRADRRGGRQSGAGTIRSADGAAQSRLHRDPRADRRLRRQPRGPGRRLRRGRRRT